MDRVRPGLYRPRRRRISGLAALCAGLALLAGTCDNPVDLLGQVEVSVMKANDRYLEVTGIEIPLSGGTFSPTGTIEIVFDRAIDPSSIDPTSVIIHEVGGADVDYPAQGVSYLADSRTLRIRVYPYLKVNTDFTLSVLGVKGLDDSVIHDAATVPFKTRNILAGSITALSADDADSHPGYTISEVVDMTLETNDLYAYVKLDISIDGGATWVYRSPAWMPNGTIELSNFNLSTELGVVGDGPVNLLVRFLGNTSNAGDPADIGTEDTASIILDRTLPAMPADAPDLYAGDDTGFSSADDITRYASGLTFSGGGVESGATVFLMTGATELGSLTAGDSGTWSIDAARPDGVYEIYAYAEDRAGNKSANTDAVTVHVDSTAPSISVANTYAAAAASQIYLNSGTYTFTAAVTNGGTEPSPIQKVDFYLDGSATGLSNLAATDAVAAYDWAWDTSVSAEGVYYVKAYAVDMAGNDAVSVNARYLDKTAPTVGGLTNTYGGTNQNYLKDGTFTVTAPVTNSGTAATAIQKVEFYKDTASAGLVNLVATDTVSAYTWSWVTSSDPDGVYYLKARAFDNAGNVSSWAANQRIVDKTVPSFSSFVLNAGAAYATNATLSASQSIGGADEMYFVYYTYSGTSWVYGGATAPSAYAASASITVAAGDQSKLVYLYARDYAGNYAMNGGNLPYDTIILDTTPPSPPIVGVNVTPISGQTTASSVTWTWSSGGGGNGTYQWEFNDATPDLNVNSTTSSTQSVDGAYTLYVQERDAAGNWSAVSSLPVRLTPVIPYNGATVVSRSTNIYWRPVVLTFGYKLEFATSALGPWTAVYSGTSTYYDPPLSLEASIKYYYRVSSKDDKLTYTVRYTGSFTTGSR